MLEYQADALATWQGFTSVTVIHADTHRHTDTHCYENNFSKPDTYPQLALWMHAWFKKLADKLVYGKIENFTSHIV